MLVSDVFEEIRDDGDLGEDRFPDKNLLYYLNSAIRNIQRIGYTALPEDFLFQKSRTYIANNFNRYSMPVDIYTEFAVYSMYDQDNRRMRRVRRIEAPAMYEYALTGSGWISGGGWERATMVYCRQLETMTKTEQRLPLPDTFRDFIVFYCIKRAKAADAAGGETATFLSFTQAQSEQMVALFRDMSRDDPDVEVTEPGLFTY